MTTAIAVKFVVNGKATRVSVPPMKRLLDVLREDCRLTGTKEGCGEGECGACTVLIDGQSVNSCLVPAFQAEGRRLTTVEGLARGRRLTLLQQAFVEMGGAQCGICTPGILVSSSELLARSKGRVPSEDEVREALAGNLCRCTGYQKIIDSVRAAASAARRGAQATAAPRARSAKAKARAGKTARAKPVRTRAANLAKTHAGTTARAKPVRVRAANLAKTHAGTTARAKPVRVRAANLAKTRAGKTARAKPARTRAANLAKTRAGTTARAKPARTRAAKLTSTRAAKIARAKAASRTTRPRRG